VSVGDEGGRRGGEECHRLTVKAIPPLSHFGKSQNRHNEPRLGLRHLYDYWTGLHLIFSEEGLLTAFSIQQVG
jgi:hypothetical protein